LTVTFNGNSVNKKNVKVSGLLRNKFNTQKDDYVIGKEYSSSITEQDWKLNPFQLIRYRDAGDNDCLLLACVNERTHIVRTVVDPLGNQYDDIIYRFHAPSYYMMYRDNYTTPYKK
jgi:hypothetical protein